MTTVDFATVQESKVWAKDCNDAEAAMRNLGWSTAITPRSASQKGWQSAGGGAVSCRKQIGTRNAIALDAVPARLKGRLQIKWIGAVCPGFEERERCLHDPSTACEATPTILGREWESHNFARNTDQLSSHLGSGGVCELTEAGTQTSRSVHCCWLIFSYDT